MHKSVKIRDLRIKEKFQIDDEYLNGYARLCGWKATLVYSSLCRHADKDQYSFPSVDLMAEQHGVSRYTIMDGIKALQDRNIIAVIKERTKGGTWRNNGYTLLDKSEWKEKPHTSEELRREESPSRPQQPDHVANSDTKDTHKKETHNNENDNGTFDESSLRAYLRTDIKDDSKRYINQIINYYFYSYKKKTGVEHPHLKSDQLQRLKDALRTFTDEHGMDGEDWGTLINHWFSSTIDTDYNINHFSNEEILSRRYFEVLY